MPEGPGRASRREPLESRILLDTLYAMNRLLRSSEFDRWLTGLADQRAKARILARMRSAEFGNFGDCEPIGEGVSEMRVHVGAGYRVYFVRIGAVQHFLLNGGDKSTQRQDIARAIRMADELKREMKP